MKKNVLFLFVAVFLAAGCSAEKKDVEKKGKRKVACYF